MNQSLIEKFQQMSIKASFCSIHIADNAISHRARQVQDKTNELVWEVLSISIPTTFKCENSHEVQNVNSRYLGQKPFDSDRCGIEMNWMAKGH